MLASIKKQLEEEKESQEAEIVEEIPFLIFGITPKRFLILAILSLLGIYLLIKLIIWLYQISKKKYKAYLVSEKYYFNKVSKSIRKENTHELMQNLTLWILQLNINEHNFDYFLKTYGTNELKSEYQNLKIKLYNSGSKETPVNYNKLLSSLKASRKNYFMKPNKNIIYSDWLNPIK